MQRKIHLCLKVEEVNGSGTLVDSFKRHVIDKDETCINFFKVEMQMTKINIGMWVDGSSCHIKWDHTHRKFIQFDDSKNCKRESPEFT